ncbi:MULTISPECIES: hypothetical protein [unclassified Tolypothrix]|uniref:hypothetical protein n=1 Tax=unclassified Tolypothrix TaxID=2649714 RepID=UPI0005EABA77|nr:MULTISPECIES: hypothetical protein [unclassified Tolypothrix]BAY95671.1 hypothetical protein NIES3275_77480 [Microchaete diplosiphon NIES-3275]EKE96367.1 hypothetical protein FDUTEX481_03490 [Tolypothrix sp. PCC 7601]MBE9083497.1 hypothetical protein [Tolypothrix sp. LEGE 11397]UYD30895.1 hypothetical protein HGR01_39105 [Tolypothrix sp. PCC 7712]UYD38548.1 hypothetical protein HG267_39355 [Tolypothrix sp. PCC 7601]
MQNQALPELVAQAQQLLTQIRQHPQFLALQIDADVTIGDVTQFFNALGWEVTATAVDVSKEGFFQ